MATEEMNQPIHADPPPHPTEPRPRWWRPLALAAAIVFCTSSAFPAVAGFVKDTESWPKWWGVLDVVIAFVLAMLALAVLAVAQGKVDRQAEDASYRAYRVLIHGIFAMLVLFLLFGDGIVWGNCLPGYAWRTWLLFYSLPAWFAVAGVGAGRGGLPRI
jgi:hypothetical protein